MFGSSLSLEHVLLQLGHFPSEAMHLRIHIEQKVCAQRVMTGLERNSLQTSQRKAASSGSKAGSDEFSQSVESGRSKEVSMGLWCGAMSEIGVLVPGEDGSVHDASTRGVSTRSRETFTPTLPFLASQNCWFRTFEKKLI